MLGGGLPKPVHGRNLRPPGSPAGTRVGGLGAPFSSLLRRAELLNSRCFGRPRRLFRCYGLALLAFCAGVATAAAGVSPNVGRREGAREDLN